MFFVHMVALVIIFDDMIRSGSSIIKAAEAYKNSRAKDKTNFTIIGA